MSSKPFPLSYARCLLRLENGEQLNSSEIKAKTMLKQFYEDGIIQCHPLGNRRSAYYCPNAQLLQNYLIAQYDILSLKKYIEEFENTASDGESSLGATKSTKTFRDKSLQGFFIKALNSEISVSGQTIQPVPQGIALFVHQPERLKIPKTALIVGVENPECFLKFERLAHLFTQKELVVIMRYLSHSPNRWLQTITNNYLHFGDFDPAGLSIYINEYRTLLHADRCSFFIPQNIEELLEQFGQTILFDSQIQLLENIDFTKYSEILNLVKLMQKFRKGMEQERLL